MEPIKFTEVKDLLNACRLANIEDKPSRSGAGWDLYQGSLSAHVFTVPFQVLYLQADATVESLRKAQSTITQPGETIVVYAPSSKAKSTIKELFSKTKGLWSTTEYLASFMKGELDAYRQKMESLLPKDYVEVTTRVPAGTTHKYPSPVELFVSDPPQSSEVDGAGAVAVVLAEAGHGKTYLCESLVARLAKKSPSVLPIYVSSLQWQTLRPEELSSLERTVVSSFRALGASIPWIDGQEDRFLRVGLKAGLFRIVFDGFDEYVLRSPGEIDARETLARLTELASETGARVVVTARSSFWAAEFGNDHAGLAGKGDASPCVFELLPFDANAARNYFNIRLPGNATAVESAVAVFRELSKEDPEFSGRGFVLLLLADLARDGTLENLSYAQERPLLRLIRAHCERDRLRHQLALSAQQQIDCLKRFVFEVHLGEDATTDTLMWAAQVAAGDIGEEVVKKTVDKMAPHALIVREKSVWRIRQPQVETALLAMELTDLSLEEGDVQKLLHSFSTRPLLEPGFEADLAMMLARLALQGGEKAEGTGTARLRSLIQAFFVASEDSLEKLRIHILRRLATGVALNAVELLGKRDHKERASFLATLFPNERFRGVVFFGALSRFDFSEHTFERCVFDSVRWSNCQFNSRTRFSGCVFLGGGVQHCTGIAEGARSDCKVDDSARHLFQGEEIRAGRRAYRDDDLMRDMRFVLEKFLGKGGLGFGTIEEGVLGRGRIASSIHKDKIIDELRRSLMEEHHISGGSKKGLHIQDRAKEAVRAFLVNNAPVGVVAETYAVLRRKTGSQDG